MRRPRFAVIAPVLGLGLLLSACQLPAASGSSKTTVADKAGENSAEIIPFGPLSTDPAAEDLLGGGMASIPDTMANEAPDTTEAEVIEADAEDNTPPESTTTSPSKNPICKAAKRVVTLSTTIDKALAKAVTMTSSGRLVRTLRAMPVTDLRNAYDDLSAELTVARRRKLAVVRDWVVDVGMALVRVTGVSSLTKTMLAMESDKRAESAAINNRALSKYIKGKCDFALTKMGDTLKG